MTPSLPRLSQMRYVTALTGMYGDTRLEVSDLDSAIRFAFDGLRGDALVVAFTTLGPAFQMDPGRLDEQGRLTPEATAKLIRDAHTQVAVAGGRPIVWACARAEDADQLQELLTGPLADLRTAEDVVGIEVVHLPADLLRREWLARAEQGLWTPPLDRLPEPEPDPEPEVVPAPAGAGTRSVAPIVPPDAGGPIPETLLPGEHRPVRFGGSRTDTSIAVPLGIPGQPATVGSDIPQRPIELGGEVTQTAGAATVLWDFLGTVPPGTSIVSVLAEITTQTGAGMPAIAALLQLHDLGLLALVDLGEPAAVHAFATTYRLLPTVALPAAAPAGQPVGVQTPSGHQVEVDGLLVAILAESGHAPDLASACAPHGPVHGPDHRPRLFRAPNLRRRHRSQVHENGIVGWVLDEAVPLVGAGVVAFELATAT